MAERGVVRPRDVPCVVDAEPDRQRDERVGEGPRAGDPLELPGHARGQADHDQQRAPLGEHDVLEQVHDEQVVEGKGVQRRDLDGEHQPAAHPRSRRSANAAAGNRVSAIA